MARIRSVHPGQWKDEDFVELSPNGRLLSLALRNFADDRGAFEWKPKTLKMEVFPADTVEVEPLLAELVAHNQITRYEHSGKPYGAIRNFRRWQRPEKPKYLHPFDDTLLSYVGLSPTAPPSEPRRVVDRSSKSSAEEGGRREEEGRKKSTSATADVSPPRAETPPLLADGTPLLPPEPKPGLPLDQAVNLWNEICGPALGRVAKLTDPRRKHLRARLVEHWVGAPLDGWRAYCQRIMRSDFLTGRRAGTGAHAGWKADFDWACNAANAVKIIEGRYDNTRGDPDQPRVAPGTV